jgi:hypothetical protein
MGSKQLILGLGFVTALAGAGCAVSDEPSTGASANNTGALEPMRASLHDPVLASKLRTTALAQASLAGVASPATMHAAVAMDRQAAEDAIGGSVIEDNSPVYVVQMTGGKFVPPRHQDLAGGPATTMTVTLDARTLSIVDVHYDGEAPDLHAVDAHLVDIASAELLADSPQADPSEPVEGSREAAPQEEVESSEGSLLAGGESPATTDNLVPCTPRPAPNGHYYAVLQSPGNNSARFGARLGLNTTRLTGNNSKWVDHEMWYGLNAWGDTFVEVGVTDGVGHHRTIFWAEYKPGNHYAEHYYPTISWRFNTYYQTLVQQAVGNGHPVPCAWNVGFGGHLGYSVNNCPRDRNGAATNLRWLEAGIEATGYALLDTGYLNNWQEQNSFNGPWMNGWPNRRLVQFCPATINFRNSNTTGENL